MLKKIVIMFTIIAVSMTILSSFSVSAESTKLSRAKITKITSGSWGEMTLKLKKVKRCSGYVVKISQNKNFFKSKNYNIKANEKTFRNLKQGKKYYVKAKVYKNIKVDGKPKTVYGKWSKAKSVTVKENEKDKERREQIKKLTGIKLKEDVHFLNYTYNQYTHNFYNFIRGYDDTAITYSIFAKIKINKNNLTKILNNKKIYYGGFHKVKKFGKTIQLAFGGNDFDEIPLNGENFIECSWWDLKKSNCKTIYKAAHAFQLNELVAKMAVNSYIFLTKSEKNNNGFVTAYLALQ